LAPTQAICARSAMSRRTGNPRLHSSSCCMAASRKRPRLRVMPVGSRSLIALLPCLTFADASLEITLRLDGEPAMNTEGPALARPQSRHVSRREHSPQPTPRETRRSFAHGKTFYETFSMTAKKASDRIWFRHAAWCCILANQGCVTPAPSPAPLTNETRDTARQGGSRRFGSWR